VRKAFIAVFVILISGLFVRAAFDPTIGCNQIGYREFQKMLDKPDPRQEIEFVRLQAGEEDFWGRDIAFFYSQTSGERFFVAGPKNIYISVCERCRETGVPICNECMSLVPIVEVLITLAISACILTANAVFNRVVERATKPLIVY
jgi:hypothetical protein